MPSAAELVNRAANRAYEPPPSLSLADWADQKRKLGADGPEGGKYKTSKTPYTRQPMECLSLFHPARHIAIEKCTQSGFTELAVNWVGYTVDMAPSSMMITLPSQDVAKEWSNQRLTQLIEETECLRGKIQDARRRASTGSTFLKRIKGTSATIKLAWVTSSAKLRSTPAGYLISDEVDAFEGDVQGEGDPLYIIDCRMENFKRGKHLMISSPTHSPSRIDREFRRGDQRYFFVSCPFCRHYQALDFHRLRWPERPVAETQVEALARCAKVSYLCLACEQRIPERFKTQMLAGGMWVATAAMPDLIKRGFQPTDVKTLAPIFAQMEEAEYVSFHLAAMYKPLGWKGASWQQLALDWEAAKAASKMGQQGLLKGFINTKLAEVWQERGDAPPAEAIYGKREFYELGVVPPGGLFLTLVADVHKTEGRGIEWELKAWGRNRESWSVAADTIEGDTSTQAPWDALAELIKRDWPHRSGALMPVWAAAVDTGYRPQRGYDFCSQFPQPAYGPAGAVIHAVRTVVPFKGGHAWDRAIEGFSSIEGAKKRDGLRIITVGSSFCKQEVFNAIRLQMPVRAEGDDSGELVYPGGYWHYPDYRYVWFQGLCSESRVMRNGKPEWVWDKSVRNEPLDLGGYHVALYELIGAAKFSESNWEDLERRVFPPASAFMAAAAPQADQPRRILKSSWLER